MSLWALAALINGIAATGFGLFVYLNNKKNPTNISWGLFSATIAFWSYNYFLWQISNQESLALFWCRALTMGSIFIPIVFLHFLLIWLDMYNSKKKLLIFCYFISLVASVLNFTPLVVEKVEPILFFKYWPKAGPAYLPFLVFWWWVVIYCWYIMYKAMQVSPKVKKNQIFYVFIAAIIGFSGGFTNYPLWYDIKIPPYGNILVSVYVGLMAYAIVRHQLMEIEVIIKKTLVFAGLFASTYAVVAGVSFLGQAVFEQITGGNRWLSLAPSIFILVLVLRPLENFLVSITDKFLFQKKYDYKDVLKTFSTEVLTVLDKDVLVHTIVDKLSNTMKIDSCGLLLFNKTKNQHELVASVGVGKNWRDIKLNHDNTLASFLNRTKTYLSTAQQGKDSPLPRRIIDDMNKLKLELAIPLLIHEDMIGILTLGKKKSDEEYTQDDMDMLLPLARTLAIAISNANVLDELGKTQAEAAQREKMAVIGTLSAGINHEICNPLGIARGQCEAFLLNIKDGLYKGKTDKELLDKSQIIMNKVIHEVDRATTITKRLSSFAKPSKGLWTDDINIKESVDEVLALIGYEMKLDKIELENSVPNDLTHIIGDRKQIQEVFFNVIRNAAQAITEKGKITIRAREEDSKVHIEVEDTGQGIPEDKIEQIFNPFYTTKDPGKGTGLGLFIVRQVIERNGGRISVKSKEGVGTTFTLEFPCAQKVKV